MLILRGWKIQEVPLKKVEQCSAYYINANRYKKNAFQNSQNKI